MALNAYLRMVGAASGQIKGSTTQKGREGKIMVIAASHEIVSPRDAASGQATGRRMHKPFVIVKRIDKSTPLLYQVLATNENITEWELQFFTPKANGTEKLYYTVKLTNASIASIAFTMPNTDDPDLAKRLEYEEVAFTYQKIEWTWVEGGITALDDWSEAD
jgi:type VI secretion system secreted protein Hcp